MIVRITNRGNRHYNHYGIVYKIGEDDDRQHEILMLIDRDGNRCIKTGVANAAEVEVLPEEAGRKWDAWSPALCDTNIHSVAADLAKLVADGHKYRKIKELLSNK